MKIKGIPMLPKVLDKKSVAIALSISLMVAGMGGIASVANATTAETPTIIFNGNTLASSVPVSETTTREPLGALTLVSTAALSRTSATTRAGYSFAGWSLTPGGPVATSISTTTTADTTRTIYAVWTTRINYNRNSADSGSLAPAVTGDTYRFGQVLTLPTVGTLAKSGYSFAGWMSETGSANRSLTYSAASSAAGNVTLYAAWIKTVSFNSNGATTGTLPVAQTFVLDGPRLVLPTISTMTLRKPGYDFLGWSTTATGSVVNGPGSYVPLAASQTLYAIWQVQSTRATARVFFKPGRSGLFAAERAALRDIATAVAGKTAIKIQIDATRARTDKKSLGKARINSVVSYLQSQGVTATITRSNAVGKGSLASSKVNNRATITATWTNPS